MGNLKDFIEINERMSDFDLQYRRLIKKIWKIVHPDKQKGYDKFKKEREELDKAIEKVDKKKIKELFAKLDPETKSRVDRMFGMTNGGKGPKDSRDIETKKERSVRLQKEQAFRAMENESVNESISLNEMLLNESISLEAEKYRWALEELRFRPREEDVQAVIEKSKRKSVDHALMIGLVTAESGFRHNVVHHNGGSNDYGLFQLNNIWHNQHKGNVSAHIDAGIDHFKWCMKTERNNLRRALSRYNTGGGDSAAGRSYAAYVLRTKQQIDDKAKSFVVKPTASQIRMRNKIERMLIQ